MASVSRGENTVRTLQDFGDGSSLGHVLPGFRNVLSGAGRYSHLGRTEHTQGGSFHKREEVDPQCERRWCTLWALQEQRGLGVRTKQSIRGRTENPELPLRERRHPALCLVALAALCAALPGCGKGKAREADITLEMPQPSALQVDVLLLMDQSGSLKGPRGTDPAGIRIEAAKYAVSSIAAKSSAESPNRVGVVDFADYVTMHSPPLQAVSATAGIEEATGRIAIRSLGNRYTNVIAALRRAAEAFSASGSFEPGRNPRLILFTDGLPEDARGLPPERYFAEIEEFSSQHLKAKGVELYVIAVDVAGRFWPKYRKYWERIAGPERIAAIASVEELRWRYNDVINRIFSIPSAVRDVLTTGSKSFELKPYLDRVEFHVFPSTPKLVLQLRRPDGRFVDPGEDGDAKRRRYPGYEIVSVYDPEPGTWSYEIIEGKGHVEIYRNEVPVHMQLVAPRPVHPQGKELQVVARFSRTSGRPLKSDPRYPLSLTGRVVPPTGDAINLLFTKPSAGYYLGRPSFLPKLPGDYTITLRTQAPEALDVSVSYRVSVGPDPYLALHRPTERRIPVYKTTLDVAGELKVAEQPVTPEEHFATHPERLYLVQLLRTPAGGRSPAVYLDRPEGSQFRARLALPKSRCLLLPMAVSGDYMLKVSHIGTALGGEAAKPDESLLFFEVRRGWLWPVVAAAQVLMLTYLGLALGSRMLLALRLMKAYPMTVQPAATYGEERQSVALPDLVGRRWRTCRLKAVAGLAFGEPAAEGKEDEPLGRGRARKAATAKVVFWGATVEGDRVGLGYYRGGIARTKSLSAVSGERIGEFEIQL